MAGDLLAADQLVSLPAPEGQHATDRRACAALYVEGAPAWWQDGDAGQAWRKTDHASQQRGDCSEATTRWSLAGCENTPRPTFPSDWFPCFLAYAKLGAFAVTGFQPYNPSPLLAPCPDTGRNVGSGRRYFYACRAL